MVVATEPSGALVTTDLETSSSVRARKKNPETPPRFHGCLSTPCEFEMSRRAEFIMTITKKGYEPVEIGVDHSLHRESLNANLAGSAGTGVAVGVASGALASAWISSGLATGSALGAGALAAATVASGVGAISLGVDAASGAMLNLNPNPVFLVLPPEGQSFLPDPKVAEIRAKRDKSAKGEKKRSGRIIYDRDLFEASQKVKAENE